MIQSSFFVFPFLRRHLFPDAVFQFQLGRIPTLTEFFCFQRAFVPCDYLVQGKGAGLRRQGGCAPAGGSQEKERFILPVAVADPDGFSLRAEGCEFVQWFMPPVS